MNESEIQSARPLERLVPMLGTLPPALGSVAPAHVEVEARATCSARGRPGLAVSPSWGRSWWYHLPLESAVDS
jgi:hypothetical protein